MPVQVRGRAAPSLRGGRVEAHRGGGALGRGGWRDANALCVVSIEGVPCQVQCQVRRGSIGGTAASAFRQCGDLLVNGFVLRSQSLLYRNG